MSTDLYAERIARVESTLIAVYEGLPVWMKLFVGQKSTNEAGITVEENISNMRKDVSRYDETGQI